MKTFIQIISVLALVCGLAIAYYSWQEQNIVNVQAEQVLAQAKAQGHTDYSWTRETIPPTDRALGLAFGLGLSFLGAFGLYAVLRLPNPPAA